MAPFSVLVFGVVVWTREVSGAKQFRFQLKTDQCGRGLAGRSCFAEDDRKCTKTYKAGAQLVTDLLI